MKIAIITGTSRGLGLSITRLLLQSGIHVIGMSREGNDQLTKVATNHDVTYTHFNCDIGNMDALNTTIKAIDQHVLNPQITDLFVINNAATVQPITQAHKMSSDDLIHHYQVNVVAPMTLINHYLQFASNRDITCYGVTVTSGAAERPIYGWSAYCSSKASINMYTQTVALEQASLKTNHKVIAFNPGVMDTDMQRDIREHDVESFQDVETFRAYKKNNQLRDPDIIGAILVNILKHEETIENGRNYNVVDYLTV